MSLRGDPTANLLGGGCGGLLSLVVGHPLDTVKVRLQTMQPATCPKTGCVQLPYSGGVDCLIKSVRSEGFFSLYRGMSGLAVTSIPRFAAVFYANAWGRLLSENPKQSREKDRTRSRDADRNKKFPSRYRQELSWTQILAGGVFSQLLVSPTIVNPLERTKVLLQTSNSHKGQLDCFTFILRTEGVRGLFKGATLSLGRDIPSFCTYFLAYETMRGWILDADRENYLEEGGVQGVPIVPVVPEVPTVPAVPAYKSAIIGGLAGVLGWAVAIPLDNVKNRHQAQLGKTSVISTLKGILQEGGWKQFYRGSGVVLVRAFPANAATFVGYEWTIQLLEKIRQCN